MENTPAKIDAKRRNILISEPCASNASPFLPYVWAVLKTSAEADDLLAEGFSWLDPIHRTGRAMSLLAAYDSSQLDVLGLSCYTWNFDLQCEIAAIAKAANPGVLVVAGGPHPAVNRPDFFRLHPYIDVVVRQDGELTFNKLLRSIYLGTPIAAIPGLCLSAQADRTPISTGAPELPVAFDRSPYIEQSAYFSRLLAEYGPGKFSAVWETNRGCPYSCSFCDWGSNTMSRIRKFDLARVEREAEWLAQMNMRMVFLADANFGIFPRDVDIARRLVDFHKLHGGPRALYYSPAKNNPDRALAIAIALAESKIVAAHTLAIQHTDPVVLASMSRENISSDKQRDVALQLLDAGIPIDVQLIIGIPGDTCDRWKNCLSDLMTWGIHEDYFISFFNLLPNAPASEPAFIDTWDIRTAHRRTHNYSSQITRNPEDELVREHVVFQSRGFDSAAWVAMNVYASFVRALHCHGFTRLIANYLHATHDLSYREFYEILIEDFFKNVYGGGRLLTEVNEHYRRALADDGVLDEVDLSGLLGFPCALSVARSIFVRVSLNVESFFEQLEDFLVKRLPSVANLRSITQFQSNVLIMPSYQAAVGKSFAADHDWPGYFSLSLHRSARGTVGEPVRLFAATIIADDTTCGNVGPRRSIDWSGLTGDDRLRAWLSSVVCGRMSSASSNLRSLTVRANSQEAQTMDFAPA
jgi:putative methyltransferase